MNKRNSLLALMLMMAIAFTFTNCKNDSSDSGKEGEATEEATAATTDVTNDAFGGTGEIVSNLPVTTVEWTSKSHDFGDIPKGEKQNYVFTFKNTGDNPLVISSATAGCGCTVPRKPEEPIAPGATGELAVEYNGSGSGKISKNVTVLLNTAEGQEILNITGNVVGGDTPQ